MSKVNSEIPEAQIQQVINDVQKEAAAATGGFPLEVSIPGTPQVFKGATPQEVLDQLVQAQTHASQTIKQEREQREAMQQELADLKARIPQQPSAGDAAQQKIQDRYATWAKNPTEATRQDLADIIGVPPEKVGEFIRTAVQASAVNTASNEFLQRCPDYPQTPEAAEIMQSEMRRRFGGGIEAASADHLELVYHQAVRNGKMQPKQLPISGVTTPNVPMPNLRGSSLPNNPAMDIMAQAHTMPLDQLKAVLDRMKV